MFCGVDMLLYSILMYSIYSEDFIPLFQLSLYSRDGVFLGIVTDVDSLVWCAQAKPGQCFIVSIE